MKTLTTFVADQEIEIYHADALPAGYGHKEIAVTVFYKGESKVFKATTNNMPSYDEAQELEGMDKYHALYELIEVLIIDQIAEWIENINE
jgi:hypothetical protein